jgi:hypothetical protein
MAPMRALLPPALVAAATLGVSQAAAAPNLGGVRARTTAAGTVHFTLRIDAGVGGRVIVSREAGALSFARRRAHLYKLDASLPVPQELIIVGPFTYSNANVQAALRNPRVKPWTKLDVRRLTAKQRKQYPDELAHVRVLAYLADGVAKATRIASTTVEGVRATRFRGYVRLASLLPHVPASQRASIRTAARNNFLDRPFPADFWVDRHRRLRRVRVAYATAKGMRVVIDGRFSKFGVAINVKLPPKRSIADISPR